MKAVVLSLLIASALSGIAPARAADAAYEPGHALTIAPRKAPVGTGWRRPRASVVTVPVDPTGTIRILTPFATVETPDGPQVVRVPHYRGMDGAYDTAADLTNDINGVPCGLDCTARSLVRWGYRP